MGRLSSGAPPMPEFQFRSEMPASAADTYAWHVRPCALERLLPPWGDMRVLHREGGVEDGGTVLLALRVGPLKLRWLARHEDPQPGRQFVDEQVRGPFAKWRHTHRFMPHDADRCTMADHIHFRSPLGGLGHR